MFSVMFAFFLVNKHNMSWHEKNNTLSWRENKHDSATKFYKVVREGLNITQRVRQTREKTEKSIIFYSPGQQHKFSQPKYLHSFFMKNKPQRKMQQKAHKGAVLKKT